MRRSRNSKADSSSDRGGTLRFILGVALFAWIIRSFIFTPYNIPSGSMLPTLYIGDYVVAAKWPYGFSRFSFPLGIPSFDGRILSDLPERGDVVVFASPTGQRLDLIKRVIGLPGDSIEVRSGQVVLNGRPLQRDDRNVAAVELSPNSPCRVVPGAVPVLGGSESEPACVYETYRETLPNGVSYRIIDQVENGLADNLPSMRVPDGHVFLMGDNRDDSLDSRFSTGEGGIGFVPVDHLIGRATTTFWSTDGSANYLNPISWLTALRSDRIGKTFSE